VDALLWAVNWSPGREALSRESALARPDVAHYVAGWPAPGDMGLVAEAGGPIGAAWLRCFPASDPGYGFVAEDVPELSIGVRPESRGQGVGRSLVRALLAAAAGRGVARVSLSVERANRARQLYLAEGFRVVGGDDGADTLLVDLRPRDGHDHRLGRGRPAAVPGPGGGRAGGAGPSCPGCGGPG